MHVEDRPEPPRNRQAEVSKRLERIILRLLAKHPDDRYPTAAALTDDLVDCAAQQHPTADIPVPDGYLRDSKTLKSEDDKKRGWWKVW
jgi:serine/threonine-protein kinase